MPRRNDEPMSRVHIWLPDSDIAFIHDTFGEHMKFSHAIQTMVRSYINGLRAKAERRAGATARPGESSCVLPHDTTKP